MAVALTQPQLRMAKILALAAIYLVAGKLGLGLAFANPSATTVWAPSGIALFALLIFGYEIWPGIFLGAFLVNVLTAGSVATSLGIALGNTLEGVMGCFLVARFASGERAFERSRDIFRFTVLVTAACTPISATIGVATLAFAGFTTWAQSLSTWLTWWLGDTSGILLVTPLLLLWHAKPDVQWTLPQTVEALLLFLSIGFIGQSLFSGILPGDFDKLPQGYLCFPVLVWAAFRFGARESATALIVLAGIAIRGTLSGYGPFLRDSKNESLILLQVFLSIACVMTMTLASLVTQRKEHESILRSLSESDSLTGLSNYRHFMDVLTDEIHRSDRTGRPFAILILDLDSLKQINDKLGHLVGSRALVRIAEILKSQCRNIDTAARYGGDEFGMVLPETDTGFAQLVSQRVTDRLTSETEEPRLSISVGISEFPAHGRTPSALIDYADQELYRMKRNKTNRLSVMAKPRPSTGD